MTNTQNPTEQLNNITDNPSATNVDSSTSNPSATNVDSSTSNPSTTNVINSTTNPTATNVDSSTSNPAATNVDSSTSNPAATNVDSSTSNPSATNVNNSTTTPSATTVNNSTHNQVSTTIISDDNPYRLSTNIHSKFKTTTNITTTDHQEKSAFEKDGYKDIKSMMQKNTREQITQCIRPQVPAAFINHVHEDITFDQVVEKLNGTRLPKNADNSAVLQTLLVKLGKEDKMGQLCSIPNIDLNSCGMNVICQAGQGRSPIDDSCRIALNYIFAKEDVCKQVCDTLHLTFEEAIVILRNTSNSSNGLNSYLEDINLLLFAISYHVEVIVIAFVGRDNTAVIQRHLPMTEPVNGTVVVVFNGRHWMWLSKQPFQPISQRANPNYRLQMVNPVESVVQLFVKMIGTSKGEIINHPPAENLDTQLTDEKKDHITTEGQRNCELDIIAENVRKFNHKIFNDVIDDVDDLWEDDMDDKIKVLQDSKENPFATRFRKQRKPDARRCFNPDKTKMRTAVPIHEKIKQIYMGNDWIASLIKQYGPNKRYWPAKSICPHSKVGQLLRYFKSMGIKKSKSIIEKWFMQEKELIEGFKQNKGDKMTLNRGPKIQLLNFKVLLQFSMIEDRKNGLPFTIRSCLDLMDSHKVQSTKTKKQKLKFIFDWRRKFNVSIRKNTHQINGSPELIEEDIRQMFINWEVIKHQLNIHIGQNEMSLWNCDQVNIRLNSGVPTHTYDQKGTEIVQVNKKDQENRNSLTFWPFINSSGSKISFILNGKHDGRKAEKMRGWHKINNIDVYVDVQEKGFTDLRTGKNIVRNLFQDDPYHKYFKKGEKTKVLILDSYGVHRNEEFLKVVHAMGFIEFILRPGYTSLTQPLDTHVNSRFRDLCFIEYSRIRREKQMAAHSSSDCCKCDEWDWVVIATLAWSKIPQSLLRKSFLDNRQLTAVEHNQDTTISQFAERLKKFRRKDREDDALRAHVNTEGVTDIEDDNFIKSFNSVVDMDFVNNESIEGDHFVVEWDIDLWDSYLATYDEGLKVDPDMEEVVDIAEATTTLIDDADETAEIKQEIKIKKSQFICNVPDEADDVVSNHVQDSDEDEGRNTIDVKSERQSALLEQFEAIKRKLKAKKEKADKLRAEAPKPLQKENMVYKNKI